MQTDEPKPLAPTVDRVGTVASTLCAVHCLLCAWAPGLLTLMGLGILLDHEAEWGFTLLAAAFAAVALFFAWRRRRSALILTALGAGIAGLFASRALEESGSEMLGVGLGVMAGLTLMVGHLSNLRAQRRGLPPAS